jgi:hypothetical protein
VLIVVLRKGFRIVKAELWEIFEEGGEDWCKEGKGIKLLLEMRGHLTKFSEGIVCECCRCGVINGHSLFILIGVIAILYLLLAYNECGIFSIGLACT